LEAVMASVQDPFAPVTRADAEAALRVPVGLTSPLWLAFFGAAASASTFWWMTRWTRAAGLKSVAAAEPASFAPVEDAPEPQVLASEAVAAEVIAEATELVIDPVVEAPVLVAPEPELPPAVIETVEAAADDLTKLVGIGPKLAAALAERGVTRFAQIAAWQAKELDEIDKALSLKGRATREAWISQARKLAAV
jgi:predicted flap endonuclease-1-like 5' DNA nuclease